MNTEQHTERIKQAAYKLSDEKKADTPLKRMLVIISVLQVEVAQLNERIELLEAVLLPERKRPG